MKTTLGRISVLSLFTALIFLHDPVFAAPPAGSFPEECITPGAMSDAMPGANPGEILKACREELAGEIAVRKGAAASAASVEADHVCPVTAHDIVVDNITDLRNAVVSAAPGTVIGIDGLLDINSDFLDDVVVTADGITITCASDDAGLVGDPIAQLLRVDSNNVTIEWLQFDALLNFGVRIFGDGAVVAHNRFTCAPAGPDFNICLLFIDVSEGLAEYNTSSGGNIGIVAFLGGGVTFRDNVVENCLSCILVQAHYGGLVERNEVENCATCVWFLYAESGVARDNRARLGDFGIASGSSIDITVTGNTVEQCTFGCVSSTPAFFGDPRPANFTVTNNQLTDCAVLPDFGRCMFVADTDGVLVRDNEISNTPDTFTAVAMFGNTGLEVLNNRIENGEVFAEVNEDFVFADNVLENCIVPNSSFSCLSSGFNGPTRIHGNLFRRNKAEVFGEAIGARGPGLEISHNTVRGTYLIGIDTAHFDQAGVISHNDIDISGGPFGKGIWAFRLNNGSVEHNRVHVSGSSPDLAGILLGGIASESIVKMGGEIVDQFEFFAPARDNLVANNRVSGAPIGLLVDAGCSNTFVGNNLVLNDTGAVFTLRSISTFVFEDYEFIDIMGGTGANTLVGDGTIAEETRYGDPVVGDGYLDCDGDGLTDPNRYAGGGRDQRGGLGEAIGNILSESRGPQY